jgi:hypothetical protein
MTRFEVRKDDFEKQTGMKLESGKVYAVTGEIEGVSGFRKIYTGGGSSERMAFFPSMESSGSIRVGEKYDVRVTSVREISSTPENMGSFYGTGYRIPGREDSTRFDIPTRSFEKRTGVRFEEGKTYKISGKVGAYDFELTHTGRRDAKHLYITVPRGHAKEVEPGKEHTITITSVEEKRTLAVSGEGSTTRLTLQKRALESLGVDVDSLQKKGAGDRLVEVTVKNLSSADKAERTVYGRLQPSEGVLPLSIAYAGGKPGDKFELVKAREHAVGNFVEAFNTHKGDATKNVTLSLEGKKLYVEVDGKKFEAKSYEMEVWHLQAFLKVEVEPFKRDIRFWYDGEKVTPKFGQSWRIESFSANEEGLSLHYRMGNRMITSNFVSPADKRALDDNFLGTGEIATMVKMLSESESVVGRHSFESEASLHNYAYGRLTQSINMSYSKYLEERGNLGEDIAIGISRKFSLKEVKRHPFSNKQGRSSHEPGTDVLLRDENGDLLLLEIKWYNDSERALKKGLEDLKARESSEKKYNGEKISGAYIAALEYDMKSRRGTLHVQRAW